MILVTGGSGFIGRHLVDKLITKGHDVGVFDIKKPLRDVEWFEGNLLNKKDTLRACKNVEYIFHLASIADVYLAMSRPRLCVKVNELGTLNLLKSASKCNVKRIILASTVWVYGNKTKNVVTEEFPVSPVNNIYAKTKAKQEQLLLSWDHELEYTILRYDSSYGLKMRSNMAIAKFVERARRKEPVIVFGNGEQGRCFIHVDDLVEGTVSALSSYAKNEIFNIAGNEFITINQVIEELKKIFRYVSVLYEGARTGDYLGTRISIEKARKLLGWKPKTSFKEEIRKYIDHVKGVKHD